jgi:predicted transcriptional regulator
MADQPFQITAAVLDTVRNLSAEGFKAREIAPHLGISETTIYAYIKRNTDFARAVADGKKAFKDAEKDRKKRAAAAKKATAKSAEERKAATAENAAAIRKAKIQAAAAMPPANTAPPPVKTEKPEELTEDAKLLFITPGMPNAKLMNRYASRMVQLLDKMLDTSIQTGRSNRLIELLVEVVYGWQKTQNVTLTAKVERPVESMEDNKLIDVINIGADDE